MMRLALVKVGNVFLCGQVAESDDASSDTLELLHPALVESFKIPQAGTIPGVITGVAAVPVLTSLLIPAYTMPRDAIEGMGIVPMESRDGQALAPLVGVYLQLMQQIGTQPKRVKLP